MTTGRSPDRGAARPHHVWRLTLQILTALLITLPALVNASAGRGSFLAVGLVFAVALSAVWIVCAAGLWLTGGPRTPSTTAPAPLSTSQVPRAAGLVAGATTTSQPLARIPVARVPADQALHADVDGHVTAATSTMGAVR